MNAEGLLILVRDNPTLLPAAPETYTGQMIEFRRTDEVHMCLGCGKRANYAFVASTTAGPRWLDLCMACSHEVRTLDYGWPVRRT